MFSTICKAIAVLTLAFCGIVALVSYIGIAIAAWQHVFS